MTLGFQFASVSLLYEIGSFRTPYCLRFANCINKHFVHNKNKKKKTTTLTKINVNFNRPN